MSPEEQAGVLNTLPAKKRRAALAAIRECTRKIADDEKQSESAEEDLGSEPPESEPEPEPKSVKSKKEKKAKKKAKQKDEKKRKGKQGSNKAGGVRAPRKRLQLLRYVISQWVNPIPLRALAFWNYNARSDREAFTKVLLHPCAETRAPHPRRWRRRELLLKSLNPCIQIANRSIEIIN